MASVYLNKQL